jgi:hypothetical protein
MHYRLVALLGITMNIWAMEMRMGKFMSTMEFTQNLRMTTIPLAVL